MCNFNEDKKFTMSDKELSENLGTTIKIIRYNLTKLKQHQWFMTTTKINTDNNNFGGKIRIITIDEELLKSFFNIKKTVTKNFTNNYGKVLNINSELIEFYNEKIINNSELINMLKTYKYDTSFNAALSQLKNLNK